jgi:hypothetical protein
MSPSRESAAGFSLWPPLRRARSMLGTLGVILVARVIGKET